MTDCIVWRGDCNSHGYARKSIKGRLWLLHRHAWQWANGQIPDCLQVLHTCDNPPCVNPDHLFLGDHEDNMRDMSEKGRHWNQKKTHCKQGHKLSGVNLYINPAKGQRVCRICAKTSLDRYRRKA